MRLPGPHKCGIEAASPCSLVGCRGMVSLERMCGHCSSFLRDKPHTAKRAAFVCDGSNPFLRKRMLSGRDEPCDSGWGRRVMRSLLPPWAPRTHKKSGTVIPCRPCLPPPRSANFILPCGGIGAETNFSTRNRRSTSVTASCAGRGIRLARRDQHWLQERPGL